VVIGREKPEFGGEFDTYLLRTTPLTEQNATPRGRDSNIKLYRQDAVNAPPNTTGQRHIAEQVGIQ